jgi:hypothetical protein
LLLAFFFRASDKKGPSAPPERIIYDSSQGGMDMEQACFALPIMTGKTDDARAFMRELEGPGKAQFASSEQRLGIVKESWFLQRTFQGDLLIVYIESPDLGKALRLFAESNDKFDQWFKDQVLDITGADLNNPPEKPLSELLSSYQA